MKLSDIRPQKQTIRFAKVGVDYTLNPFSLEDENWMEQEWPDEADRVAIFKNIQAKPLMRIVYRLLDFESKKHLMNQVVIEDMDESGKPINLTDLTGPEKLIYLVSGFGEVAEIFQAMLKVRGMSLPVIKEIERLQLEKEAIKNKKKALAK